MTQQYLLGELSLILAELQAAMTSAAASREVGGLRRRAETAPYWALAPVAVRALDVAEQERWDALVRGDASAFLRQTEAREELLEFSNSSHLLTGQQPH